jgi:hypothetical protein
VNEPDAPNELPPYWGKCEEMGFDELAGFIADCLDRMYDPDPSGDRLHTQEEFMAVWRLLRQKSDAMPPDPPPPVSSLEAAYRKRARTLEHLDYAPGNPKFKKKDIRQMERTLEKLDREIEELEASGEYDHPTAPAPETPKQAAARTASRIFEDIERAFKRQPTGRRLQWRPARPGSLSISNIRRYYQERRRWDPTVRYDMDRIEKAKELGPEDPPWEGPDGFDGYVIFTFPGTEKALMESPEIGNAAYVIHKDWESWSQMDKQELMAEAKRGGEVTRIPHQGENWPAKVKQALEID